MGHWLETRYNNVHSYSMVDIKVEHENKNIMLHFTAPGALFVLVGDDFTTSQLCTAHDYIAISLRYLVFGSHYDDAKLKKNVPRLSQPTFEPPPPPLLPSVPS